MAQRDVRAALDKTSESILYEGANLSQLTILFKCDHRTLKARMHGVQPIGKRQNAEIYDIAEVATRMGKLSIEQVNAAMKRMNHDQLPKQLTKEYWNGLRAKQAYELAEGDLWRTDKVITEVGEMVKTLKMELDLLTDAVERQVELSEKQRLIIKRLVNGAKGNMLQRLEERFKKQEAPVSKVQAEVEEDDDAL